MWTCRTKREMSSVLYEKSPDSQREETSSRNWNKSSCLQYSTWIRYTTFILNFFNETTYTYHLILQLTISHVSHPWSLWFMIGLLKMNIWYCKHRTAGERVDNLCLSKDRFETSWPRERPKLCHGYTSQMLEMWTRDRWCSQSEGKSLCPSGVVSELTALTWCPLVFQDLMTCLLNYGMCALGSVFTEFRRTPVPQWSLTNRSW